MTKSGGCLRHVAWLPARRTLHPPPRFPLLAVADDARHHAAKSVLRPDGLHADDQFLPDHPQRLPGAVWFRFRHHGLRRLPRPPLTGLPSRHVLLLLLCPRRHRHHGLGHTLGHPRRLPRLPHLLRPTDAPLPHLLSRCCLRAHRTDRGSETVSEDRLLFPIRPAELGKTTNTTFTTSNNDANDTRHRRDISPGQLAGNVSKAKRCILLFRNKQPLVCIGLEEAMSPRSVVTCCKSCSSCFSICPRIVDRQYPREALFIVIKVIQVVFLYVHVESLHVPDEPDKGSETVSEDRRAELFLPATRFFQKFYVSLHP